MACLVLYLDSISSPTSGLDSPPWKPALIALLLMIATYTITALRTLNPQVGYFDRVTLLTIHILLLTQIYNQSINANFNSSPSTSLSSAMLRAGLIALGIVIPMAGSLLFFPLTISMARNRAVQRCLTDLAEFWQNLYTFGLAVDPSLLLPKERNISRMAELNSTRLTISTKPNSAAGTASSGSKSPSHQTPPPPRNEHEGTDLEMKAGGPSSNNETIHLFRDSHITASSFLSPEQQLRKQVHPISISIIRTLERERERLEVGVERDFRFVNQRPKVKIINPPSLSPLLTLLLSPTKFIPIKPVDQVVRRLRNLYYHLISIYIDRLGTFKLLSSLQDDSGLTSLSPRFFEGLVQDQSILFSFLFSEDENNNNGKEVEDSPFDLLLPSSAFQSPTSSADHLNVKGKAVEVNNDNNNNNSNVKPIILGSAKFRMARCTRLLSKCLTELSAILAAANSSTSNTSSSSSSGTIRMFIKRSVGSAELSTRCLIVKEKADQIASVVAEHVQACRQTLVPSSGGLNAAMLMAMTSPVAVATALSSTSSTSTSPSSRPRRRSHQPHPAPSSSSAGASRESLLLYPHLHHHQLHHQEDLNLSAVALKYTLLFKYWELAIEISKCAAAVEELVRSQS